MKKKSSTSAPSPPRGPDLFSKLEKHRHCVLFLPRFLTEEAKSNLLRGKKQEQAHEILRNGPI